MIDWLRARMHVFPLVFLALALIALCVNWILTENTKQETLTTLLLGAGAGALFVLKWNLVRKSKRND